MRFKDIQGDDLLAVGTHGKFLPTAKMSLGNGFCMSRIEGAMSSMLYCAQTSTTMSSDHIKSHPKRNCRTLRKTNLVGIVKIKRLKNPKNNLDWMSAADTANGFEKPKLRSIMLDQSTKGALIK